MRFDRPKSKLLQGFLGYMGGAVTGRLIYEAFADKVSLMGALNDFLSGLIMVYIFGAFWSNLPLVLLSALVFAAILAVGLAFPQRVSLPWCKFSSSMLVVLSLITLWFEPFLTNAGLATEVAKILLRVSTFIIDVMVTIFWLIMLNRVHRHLALERASAS